MTFMGSPMLTDPHLSQQQHTVLFHRFLTWLVKHGSKFCVANTNIYIIVLKNIVLPLQKLARTEVKKYCLKIGPDRRERERE